MTVRARRRASRIRRGRREYFATASRYCGVSSTASAPGASPGQTPPPRLSFCWRTPLNEVFLWVVGSVKLPVIAPVAVERVTARASGSGWGLVTVTTFLLVTERVCAAGAWLGPLTVKVA